MPTDPDASILPQLILIVILTLINAFFASAEMAIVSMKKTKIRVLAEEGNKKAILLEKLLEEPSRFLSTIQVGITLAGYFSSASAATGISSHLGVYLAGFGVPYSSQISLIAITLVLSYITLVFGELVPKRIAMQYAEKIALASIRPIFFIQKFTLPFVKLLSLSTNLILRILGLNKENLEESVSLEEIRSLVNVGQEHGVINETEREMINSIIEFDNITAEEIMTPRTEVYLINIERALSDYLDELLEEKYSRIPVYEGDSDNIIGILYMKDFFLEARKVGFDHVNIRSLLRPAYFVFERKNIDDLFKELQVTKTHMAILIDEYGGFSGIVTIEDLIEEVMGDIDDEHDEDLPQVVEIDSNTFIVDGLMTISEVNYELDLGLDEESNDYDTLGGMIIQLLGHIPTELDDTVIPYKNHHFSIEEIKDKRIEKVKIVKNPVIESQLEMVE